MTSQDRYENYQHQLFAQPATIADVLTRLRPLTQALGQRVFERKTRRIFLTGCGDSLFAALSTRFTFLGFSGIHTEAVEALEFSRYLSPHVGPGDCVVAISNSGRVVRTREALEQAMARGAFGIALTNSRDNPLVSMSDASLCLELEPMGPAPQTRSYIATQTVLSLLARAVAELTGHASASALESMDSALNRVPQSIAWTLDHCVDPVEVVAERCTALPTHIPASILGAGPNFATALYGAAKFMEVPALNVHAQQLEEWAHLEFFLTGPGSVVIIIAPPGAADDRAMEIARAVSEMEGFAVGIVPDSPSEAIFDTRVPVASGLPEWLTPSLLCVPLQLLALRVAHRLGKRRIGFSSEKQREVNAQQLFQAHTTKRHMNVFDARGENAEY